MAPPSYSDIGKQSRDVFGKGYHFGVVKLDVKTKSSSGVEINCGGSSTTDGGKVTGNLETKYKDSKNGLTLTEKWSTDNALNTTVDIEGLTKGLKLTVDSSFQPSTGAKSGKLKADFKHDKAVINADLNLAANPVINASATVGHGAISAGYQMAFDTGKSSLTKSNFAVGYNAGGIKFQKVPITDNGRMATVEEIQGHFQIVKNLLVEWDKWTIALVDGGKLDGRGYGGKVNKGDFSKQVGVGEKIIVIEKRDMTLSDADDYKKLNWFQQHIENVSHKWNLDLLECEGEVPPDVDTTLLMAAMAAAKSLQLNSFRCSGRDDSSPPGTTSCTSSYTTKDWVYLYKSSLSGLPSHMAGLLLANSRVVKLEGNSLLEEQVWRHWTDSVERRWGDGTPVLRRIVIGDYVNLTLAGRYFAVLASLVEEVVLGGNPDIEELQWQQLVNRLEEMKSNNTLVLRKFDTSELSSDSKKTEYIKKIEQCLC